MSAEEQAGLHLLQPFHGWLQNLCCPQYDIVQSVIVGESASTMLINHRRHLSTG